MAKDRDPGDAVPPGVAPQTPGPLSREDERAKQKIGHMGEAPQDADRPSQDSPEGGTGLQADREVERMTQTVQPGSDSPSRAGIVGEGSGADAQGL